MVQLTPETSGPLEVVEQRSFLLDELHRAEAERDDFEQRLDAYKNGEIV